MTSLRLFKIGWDAVCFTEVNVGGMDKFDHRNIVSKSKADHPYVYLHGFVKSSVVVVNLAQLYYFFLGGGGGGGEGRNAPSDGCETPPLIVTPLIQTCLGGCFGAFVDIFCLLLVKVCQ